MNRERGAFSTRRFLVGKAGPFLRLVFHEEVMLRLDQFSHLHAYGEHGGFLIGRKRELKSAEQYEVFVERFVPIPQKEDAARLVITKEHWETVVRALQEGDQGEEIVGWIHTHPGFGVFLSNFDKEQHSRFFLDSWQVAYVIDTHAQERAVYHLLQGEWHRLGGYYVLRQMPPGEIGVRIGPGISWPRLAFLVLLLALVIGAGVYGYGWVRDFFGKPPTEPEISITGHTFIPEAPLKNEGMAELDQGVWEPPPPPPREEQPLLDYYGEYIVARGDNLWRIAEKLWGDPRLYRFLAEENDIKNPSIIHVGRVLKVPPLPQPLK